MINYSAMTVSQRELYGKIKKKELKVMALAECVGNNERNHVFDNGLIKEFELEQRDLDLLTRMFLHYDKSNKYIYESNQNTGTINT